MRLKSNFVAKVHSTDQCSLFNRSIKSYRTSQEETASIFIPYTWISLLRESRSSSVSITSSRLLFLRRWSLRIACEPHDTTVLEFKLKIFRVLFRIYSVPWVRASSSYKGSGPNPCYYGLRLCSPFQVLNLLRVSPKTAFPKGPLCKRSET